MKKRKSGATAPKKRDEAEERRKVAVVAVAGSEDGKRVISNSNGRMEGPVVVDAKVVDEVGDKPSSTKSAEKEEEEMRWPGGWMRRAEVVVDEQMPVGAMWFPSWDVDYMGDAYVSELYSDVWDGYDDIWGFWST